MKIRGLQKLTLLDFPGEIACTVFLGGCNFRCPFCHNGSLVMDAGESEIGVEELLKFLDGRRGRLGGVCISGGEPCLNADLPELIGAIKSLGLLVKLDTNGSRPEMLKSLISAGLIDYVAMDIKNSPDSYGTTIGIENCPATLTESIRQSAEILMSGDVDYEFRTTLVRELHTADDMHAIGRWLRGAKKYYLQTYRDEGDILVGGFSPFSSEETEELLSILRQYIPSAEIRS